MIKALRNNFISGLLLIAPLGVTIFAINLIVTKIGGTARKHFFPRFEDVDSDVVETVLNFSSTFLVLILITLLGWLSKYFLGKMIMQSVERLVDRLPFANTVYKTAKQIISTFSEQKQAVFQRTVLLEFPRPGLYALGFLTGEGKGEVQERTQSNVLNVFVPTTPNPTSGFLVMVPQAQVITLNMSVADGMKLIISGGAVVPPFRPGSDTIRQFPVANPKTVPAPSQTVEIPAEVAGDAFGHGPVSTDPSTGESPEKPEFTEPAQPSTEPAQRR